MRAAFFVEAGRLEVREVDPQPLGAGEARLRVLACGICGSDVSMFKTGMMAGPQRVLGHEIAAVVEEDPTGATRPGDRVTWWPARGCGECVWCEEGFPRYCLHPPDWQGGFAEEMVVRADTLIGVPEGVDDRAASLAEPLGIGIRAVDEAGVAEGDLAFVSGLGSIGVLVVAALRERGARVIGADIREDRRELGMRYGCEMAFDPVAEDPWWKTLAVDLHGPGFAFECSGAASAVQMAFNVCGHRGTVVLLGIPFEPVFFIPAVMSVKEQRAVSMSGPTPATMRSALDLLARRPEIADVVTGAVPLDGAEGAMQDLADGRGGVKILVEPGS